MKKYVVYFANIDSNYFKIDFEVFDIKTNSLTTNYTTPAIYPPSCRTWGRLRGFCNVHPDRRRRYIQLKKAQKDRYRIKSSSSKDLDLKVYNKKEKDGKKRNQ